MTTFNGRQENLRFKCDDCGSEIEINPEDINDMNRLSNWLLTHSAIGGKYTTIKIRNICELCETSIHYGTEYVTKDGKVVCGVCAKDISKIYIERN